MTSPPEQIEVQCPRCKTLYVDWWRPSINLTLEDFDDAYLEEATTVTCPSCGFRVSLETLVVRTDGIWEFVGNSGQGM
jgi:endogenous inhibitor of DNA gyrase (YacG/DUF329 family)